MEWLKNNILISILTLQKDAGHSESSLSSKLLEAHDRLIIIVGESHKKTFLRILGLRI